MARNSNTPIRPTDYTKPISLTIQSNALIADAAITSRSPQSLDLAVTQTLSRSLQLSTALLNPGDKAVFRLILVGDTDPTAPLALTSAGRIAGVSDIQIRAATHTVPFSSTYYTVTFWELVGCAGGTAFLLLLTLYLLRRSAPHLRTGRFADLIVVMLAVLAVAVTFWTDRIFWAFVRDMGASWWVRFWPQIAAGGVVTAVYLACLIYLALRPRPKQPA